MLLQSAVAACRALSWTSATSLLLLGQHLLTGEDQLIELSLEAQQETRQLHLQHLRQVPCGMNPGCSTLAPIFTAFAGAR